MKVAKAFEDMYMSMSSMYSGDSKMVNMLLIEGYNEGFLEFLI
jgi:hypothetical protein